MLRNRGIVRVRLPHLRRVFCQLLVRHLMSKQPIHHHRAVMELLLRTRIVKQKHVFHANYRNISGNTQTNNYNTCQTTIEEVSSPYHSLPGVAPNCGCPFMARMNDNRSDGVSKQQQLRLMSMLWLGLYDRMCVHTNGHTNQYIGKRYLRLPYLGQASLRWSSFDSILFNMRTYPLIAVALNSPGNTRQW